ncbi:MAG: helix-hairpin-helix domain-containing protein [Tannerella sp.]|jgi:DNA uptake protein ComE-like DNA-binding protein|nr:helix-hairpin-helix domain-containing protein [Tannerella sp.]
MSWNDFLYFSKGERRAFAVILVLITLSGVLFFLTNKPPAKDESAATDVLPDTVRTDVAVVVQPPPPAEKKPRETVRERVERLTRTPGKQSNKLAAGSTVELNMADTLALQKVPGIGSAFSNRIVKFRNLLGGFYSVEQLSEVYGIDEERYTNIVPWFRLDTSLIRRLPVNTLPADSLRRHPYISYRQANAIERLRKQKKRLTGWENLQLLKEFTESDKARLEPYLSFE